MNGDVAVAVLLLIGGVGLSLITYVFGYINGQHSNAEGFRQLAEHVTRDPESYTGA